MRYLITATAKRSDQPHAFFVVNSLAEAKERCETLSYKLPEYSYKYGRL